jgi:hypothetical protein
LYGIKSFRGEVKITEKLTAKKKREQEENAFSKSTQMVQFSPKAFPSVTHSP